MDISEKQKLYLNILERVLPYARNLEPHEPKQRVTHGTFYPELELVHNLPRLLVCPDFQEFDVHWLNTQAKIFFDQGRKDYPFRDAILDDLRTLFRILPDALKLKLRWTGP
jgi:hypothetical protein